MAAHKVEDVSKLGKVTEYGWDLGYLDVVSAFGAEVVVEQMVGSYQGDYLFLLRDGDQWGFLVFGYGSCSGCDWLEGAKGYSVPGPEEFAAVQKMADELFGNIKWGTAEEIAEHLESRDPANDFWLSEEDAPETVQAMLAALGPARSQSKKGARK